MYREELNLEEIKACGFDLLLSLKEFCTANQVKFYLSNGTLLGAAKYKGYIPWDDDVDVLLPRQDYDKLIHEYTDSDRIRLFSPERVSEYYFPFAKLCDMTTVKVEPCAAFETALELGVCVDIFPIDSYSNIRLLAHMKAFYAQVCVALFSLAQIENFQGKGFAKTLVYKFAKKVGGKRIWRYVQRRYTYRSCKYVGNRVWPIYGFKEVLPIETFLEEAILEFEGETFPVPTGYDAYLRALYGDYKKDPPIEEQVTHHAFTVYRKSDFTR